MNATARHDWTLFDSLPPAGVLTRQGSTTNAQFAVDGMHCGACAGTLERTLAAIPGVERISVNGATRRLQMSWDAAQVPFSRLLRAIEELGFVPRLSTTPADPGCRERVRAEKRTALKRLAVAGIGMAQVMTLAVALYAGAAEGMEAYVERYMELVSLLITVPVVFYSGAPFLTGAWRDLVTRRLSMDLPVALAIVLAFAASVFNTVRAHGEVYFDSVTMFVFLLLVARYVEMRTRQARGSVSEALAELLPQSVQRIRETTVETIDLSRLERGDLVLAPAGAAIPADGRVLAGRSRVDEALLTGESTPLMRGPGDTVVGGSLNLDQPLTLEITATGSRTLLAGIVRLLERAQAQRPHLARTADRVAALFVGGILLLSAAVAGLWLYFDPSRAFAATLSVLVVTCPCALSLATPTAIAAATSLLARTGLLVTHPDTVEALANARHCVLDKTGTLTEGAPRITHAHALGHRSLKRCLQVAAALEMHSAHPLAVAFNTPSPLLVSDVREEPGQGMEGVIDGRKYRIGRLDYVRALAPDHRHALPHDGGIFLGYTGGLLASFDIDDALRPEAAGAVAALRELGVRSEIASGDHTEAVQRVALRLGIAGWQARLTPAQKLERVQALNAQPGGVIMVGDGINDAPVLGAARVSIAMGSGCALAQASADAILMSPSLTALPAAIRISRRAMRLVRQNLWWATAYNVLAIPLAALGAIPPWAAAVGMSLSSLVVVLNATRFGARGAVKP